MFLPMPFLLYRGSSFWVALATAVLLTVIAFGLSGLIAKHFGVSLMP